MKYTHQQLLRIIERITIQENGKLTGCSKRIHPGNYEIYISAAAANNRSITIQENGKLTICSKEPIRGNMKYTHQQLLQIIEDITIQENEILTFCSKEPIQMNWKANQILDYELKEKRHTHKTFVLGDCFTFTITADHLLQHHHVMSVKCSFHHF